jgi:SAM-dependent methyltransferase
MMAAGASAQVAGEYTPHPYQEGKDVVWVPTEQALTDKMLDLAKVTPQDFVIDLGSGDGRIVITAARRGARAFGIEYNPDMVALSKRNSLKAGVSERAQFAEGDLFQSDFSQATVITMFLLPDINLKLRPRILDLKPGTRVVSNSFDMADWKADKTVSVAVEEGCKNSFCKAYLWIVPAKVAGVWKLPQGTLALNQEFQMISGELQAGLTTKTLQDGKMNGAEISFSVGDEQYTGRVDGDTMQGTVKADGKSTVWSASRISGTSR